MLKTRRDAERVRDECKEMVTRRALVAGGASAVPVPAVDAVADVAILLEMSPEINRRFELTPAQIAALPPSHQSLVHSTIKRAGVALGGRIVSKELILSALKTVGARVTAKQVIKFIPFVGSAVSAAIGFSAMKYVGDKHVDDCFGICLTLLNSSELRA